MNLVYSDLSLLVNEAKAASMVASALAATPATTDGSGTLPSVSTRPTSAPKKYSLALPVQSNLAPININKRQIIFSKFKLAPIDGLK